MYRYHIGNLVEATAVTSVSYVSLEMVLLDLSRRALLGCALATAPSLRTPAAEVPTYSLKGLPGLSSVLGSDAPRPELGVIGKGKDGVKTGRLNFCEKKGCISSFSPPVRSRRALACERLVCPFECVSSPCRMRIRTFLRGRTDRDITLELCRRLRRVKLSSKVSFRCYTWV